MADWNGDLERWLAPFLARLGHKARRRMCPLYVAGLIGPGERKSVEPMAARLAPGDYDQLHHFIASGVWDEAPLQEELAIQADKLIGGASAILVVDDTALPKKGTHSVGVAPVLPSAKAYCETRRSPTSQASSPGMCWAPLSWMRWGEPSAIRHPQDARRCDQGALGLRTGASATQGRTRSRSLRGALLARPPSSRVDDHDRIRLSAKPPPR
jgi:DDE superfamily endonuclease